MAKWILRIFFGLVALVALAAWWGYKKYQTFTAGGNTATVSIHAPAERVFAALAYPDSLTVWMGEGAVISSGRHGMLQQGDTLRVESTRADANGRRSSSFTWKVTDVTPNRLLAMEMQSDTSRQVFATRRDSIVAMGDSTLIVSTVGSPMFDEAAAKLRDSAKRTGSAILSIGSKIALSAFRVQAEHQLQRLKAHIEGKPMPVVERER